MEGAESTRRKKRKKTEQFPEDDPEFQIAPMIDVLLVLLTFFMSITSTEVMQRNPDHRLKLAFAKDGNDRKDKEPKQAIVNVIWDKPTNKGVINLDGLNFTEPAGITTEVLKKMEALRNDMERANYRILIRADKHTKYEFIQEIMLACARAKVVNITFAVDKNPQTGK